MKKAILFSLILLSAVVVGVVFSFPFRHTWAMQSLKDYPVVSELLQSHSLVQADLGTEALKTAPAVKTFVSWIAKKQPPYLMEIEVKNSDDKGGIARLSVYSLSENGPVQYTLSWQCGEKTHEVFGVYDSGKNDVPKEEGALIAI